MMNLPVLTVVGIAIAVLILAIVVPMGYTKARPDIAKIISGVGRRPRVLIGRAGFRLPFFERVDELCLRQFSVDIKTDTYIPTQDFINVKVDAVAKVRTRNDKEGIQLACKNFLNKRVEDIALDLQDSLQGNMREIIGTLDLKTINQDRDKFSDQVMAKAAKDMLALGIEILSCNIQNVLDEHGLISDMGMDNTSKIKKDAAIAKATAEKEVAIAQAEADKAANDARVLADSEIAIKKNELEIKKAQLKKESDSAKAIADAAYEIQKQEQQRTIAIATVNAEIARAEREADLKAREVTIKEKILEAEMQKKADAEKYEIEKHSDANKYKMEKASDAAKYEAAAQAEAELVKAQKEAEGIKAKAQAEAESIRLKGEAEAFAIKAKGEAEAESMQKKADAYKNYNKAAVAEMMIRVLPEMAERIAKPLSSISGISIYAGSTSDAVAGISGNMPVVMKQVFDTMSSATGVDFADILKSQTYDAKVNRNVSLDARADMRNQGEKE
ncbi:MAG TPA: flotillin family protein [Spirochaetaceae bacterium]|nr:flotillin family protein [Spirochaetaceae bacterium]